MSDLTSVKAGAAALNAAHTELHGLILNALLLPLLTATLGARVVSVLSDAQRHGADLSLVDWTMEQGYSPTAADVRSKVANILFARELARRLAAAGSPVLDVAAQPGWCTTSLLVKATPELSTSIIIAVLKPFLSRSAEAGACCLLHAATEAGVAANDYWEPSFFHAKGPPTRSSARTGLVVSDEAAAALWAKSEEVTGVVYPV